MDNGRRVVAILCAWLLLLLSVAGTLFFEGVNERGLAYDANGLPRVDTNPHRERAGVIGGYTYYPIQILHECATVADVIEWVSTHEWHSYMHDQMHFA